MFGNLIASQFLNNNNWAFGATLSVILIVIVMLFVFVQAGGSACSAFSSAKGGDDGARPDKRRPAFRRWNAALWIYVSVFFVFLYGPLLTLIAFSFNDAEVVALPFRGFTLKWYRAIFAMPELFEFAWSTASCSG